ncbi:odorant receptor 88a [Drosophila santomea]|uniref:odorant receptor 88a n=1 Tax=Drosophila santomea TaxID=129105 RepID=UPI001952D417|nr:odorant receptor 88a [Drosophila santomea]
MKTTEIKKPYRMEEFLRPQWFQKVAKMVHFQWRRNPVDNSMVNASMVPFCFAALLNVLFFSCNGWDIIGHFWLRRPANQNPPVLSITIYFSIRGLMLFLKRKEIVEFVNDLDRECPRDLDSQLDMQMDETYRNFWQRYRFIRIYSHVGGPMFCVVPLALFLLTHEGKDTPVAQHEQLLGGWLPFGVRKNPKFYFLVWFIDVLCTTCGVSFFLTFDNLFNVMQGHLVMHLSHLARQFSALDPRQSLINEDRFFAHLRLLVQRQQLLNGLCCKYNDIFKVAFLVSNFVGAGSLCFYLFMLSETSDVLIIAQYILPTLVLVGFTFEICLRGTQLEEASEGLESSLRNQVWYLGSQRYRKFYLLWTQYCQRTQKLGAFGLIRVNMVHFTEIMQLAYRLFTFLKSH